MGVWWRVPRVWPGQTVACIASGPSLTREQIGKVERAGVRHIAVNDVYRIAPYASVLYAYDVEWWVHHWPMAGHHSAPYKVTCNDGVPFPIKCLRMVEDEGFENDPETLNTGGNSGYQAICLAAYLGAKRILLLGYDMQNDPVSGKTHFFGDHPTGNGPYSLMQKSSPFGMFRERMESLIEPFADLGIEVVNCTDGGALECWPRSTLEAELCGHQ